MCKPTQTESTQLMQRKNQHSTRGYIDFKIVPEANKNAKRYEQKNCHLNDTMIKQKC